MVEGTVEMVVEVVDEVVDEVADEGTDEGTVEVVVEVLNEVTVEATVKGMVDMSDETTDTEVCQDQPAGVFPTHHFVLGDLVHLTDFDRRSHSFPVEAPRWTPQA